MNPMKFFPNAKRVYVVEKICETQVTISTISGKTFVVAIDGNSSEVTANDLSASTNQTCGYDACVPAVLFLDRRLMAGHSIVAECIDEQSSR